jgi:hypothetical protein
MTYSLRLLTIVGLSILWIQTGFAKPVSTSMLRQLSFALTDNPPSVELAKAVHAGEVEVDALVDQLLKSPEHLNRVERYFHDWFGSKIDPDLPIDPGLLVKGPDGVYRHVELGNCATEEALDASAWWLEPGETVRVCPYLKSEVQCEDIEEQIQGPECGCGKDLVLCFPEDLYGVLGESVSREFARRGRYVYENNLGWHDLLAGDFFYGDRLLYHLHLYAEHVGYQGTFPEEALPDLKAMPVGTSMKVPFGSTPERAGVVTSIGFLQRFNNFRSRIRGLTEELLCRDVDPALNTSGIAEFLNPDLDELTLTHAADPSCANCHYPMDNLGSMLLGWDTDGNYEGEMLQTGHAFGVDGTGPTFLVDSYIERGPGFAECMAKKAWSSFSGEAWTTLPKDEKDALAGLVSQGPRQLLETLFLSQSMSTLRP